tara:strand:- start:136 stop:462 length:327 start_codon:yes stop_codon:yes gene_type:complete
MPNLYEGSNYNIVNVYISDSQILVDENDNNVNGSYYTVTIQRLPTTSYPETTEIDFTTLNVSSELSSEQWIAQALPIINSELVRYDASFDGTPANAISFSNLTVMFSE